MNPKVKRNHKAIYIVESHQEKINARGTKNKKAIN